MNDGGAAFPYSFDVPQEEIHFMNKGMSLRDWFAGKALQGLLSKGGKPVYPDELQLALDRGDSVDFYFGSVSLQKVTYSIADAMLKERESDDA